MGVVVTTTFTSDTETVTRTKLNGLVANLLTEFNGSIENVNIAANAAIAWSKIATTGVIQATTCVLTSSANATILEINNDHTGHTAYFHVDAALANGKNCLLVESTIAQDTATSQLARFNQFTGSDQDLMLLDNDGTGKTLSLDVDGTAAPGIVIDQGSNGTHLRFIGDPTVASPVDGDLWFTGDNLNFRHGTTTRDLLTISVQLVVVEFTASVSTGNGKFYFHVDDRVAGLNLKAVHAEVISAGTTGTTDIQIQNVTQAADMLSTVITIDSGETGSDTAATPAVIDTANDDVAENDLLRVDIDAVQTVPPQGLIVTLKFGI